MANRLTIWGVLGFMLAAMGAVLAVAYWPETTTTFDSTLGGLERSADETGNEAAANVGLVLLGAGSVVLSVVLIAIGVYCGLRMHDEARQVGPWPSSSRQLSTAAAEQLNREAKQRIAARRAAERYDGN